MTFRHNFLGLLCTLCGIYGKGCKPPLDSFYGSSIVLDNNETDIQEVLFMGSSSPFDEGRQICKMQCQDGKWLGPVCVHQPDSENLKGLDGSCHIRSIPNNTILTYNGEQLQGHPSRFESGTVISSRCSLSGRFKLVGNPSIECREGKWVGEVPSCLKTNIMGNFKGDSYPPAIDWSVPGGAGEVDVDGSLVLLPKSILHLNCLFPRFHGNPQWHWSANYRNYPTGWALSLQERDSHYRLSVYYADKRDSGVFSCVTPKGLTNNILVKIKDVSCRDLDTQDGLIEVVGGGLAMGSILNFSCPLGYTLKGDNFLKCLPSGDWSGQVPICQVIQCPKPSIQGSHLKTVSTDLFYGGKIIFRCPRKFFLKGYSELTCQVNGTWSHDVPSCQDIICPELRPPLNGRIQLVGRRRVGSTAIFSCFSKFILKGSIVTYCASNGNWSTQTPSCEPSCDHPGRPQNGRLIPRRPRYEVGFVALVSCNPGFRPAGPDRLKCLETSRWSSPLTPCVSSFRSRKA